MILVTFLSNDGSSRREVEAANGTNLLRVAQANDQPLEGTCEGAMACSTCHVIVDADDFAKLPRAGDDEEDMLDLATGVVRTSRLACQITLEASLDRLTVRIPPAAPNMQGR